MTTTTAYPTVLDETGKSQGNAGGWTNVQYWRGDLETYSTNTLMQNVNIYEWIDGVKTRVGP